MAFHKAFVDFLFCLRCLAKYVQVNITVVNILIKVYGKVGNIRYKQTCDLKRQKRIQLYVNVIK